MPGSVIGTSLNFGFAGNVARTPDCVIAAKPVKSNSNAILFGAPVVLNTDNTYSAPTSVTVTAANFAGVAVAQVKQNLAYNQDVSGSFTAGQACDVLQRGIVCVKVQRGTVTAGGAVYVRTALNTSFPAAVVGGFEAASDGSNSVLLTNCVWNTNVADANGIAELKIRNINN